MLDNIRERNMQQLAELSDGSSNNMYVARRRRLQDVVHTNPPENASLVSQDEAPLELNLNAQL